MPDPSANRRGPLVTPDQLRDHATFIILDHVSDVEMLSISEHLEDLELDAAEHARACDAIDALIAAATITVSFPAPDGRALDA